jgi:hypothetical protein
VTGFDPLSLDALVLPLALLPGFLGMRAYLHFGIVKSDMGEQERTGWSLAVGAVLALALYGVVVAIESLATGELVFVSPSLSGLSTEAAVGGYAAILALAVALGGLAGILRTRRLRRRGIVKRRSETWEFLNDQCFKRHPVRVVTSDGQELAGDLRFAGERSHDLLLRRPEQVLREGGREGGRESGRVPLGEYVYLIEDDIRRVFVEKPLRADAKTGGATRSEPASTDATDEGDG